MTVTVLDRTFRLDSQRHALVASAAAGEVFFRVYEDGLRANVEAYTVRSVDYQAVGDYGCDGVLRVHSVKKTDWRASKRDATKAVHRTISEEIKGLLDFATEAGYIRQLERASEEWRTRDRLEALEGERAELLRRLAEVEAEQRALQARVAQGAT